MGGTLKRLNYIVTAIALVLFSAFSFRIAFATVNSCSAESTPQRLSPGSDNSFQFRINNPTGQGNDPIRWISISRPSANFSIESASASGWGSSTTADAAVLTGGTLNTGSVLTANVTAAAANIESPDSSWQVEVSSDPGGSNPANCNGSLHAQITDGVGPVISNVSVSNITSSSVVVSWTTDEPATSQVNYDLTSDYNNSSDYEAALVANHSVQLSGLSANTGYHYNIASNDGAGNGTYSDDNTFLTAAEGQTGSGTSRGGSSQAGGSSAVAVPVTNSGDKTPPTISLTSKIPKVVQSLAKISGTANDDLSVVRIEYSIDGGQNWLPVDSAPGIGGQKVNFSFTPVNLEDGNYSIEARAIDAGGNVTTTSPMLVVVDRLPPLVGASVISIGPQILQSDRNGIIRTLAGTDQRITVSAVGGPTSITLVLSEKAMKSENFSLTESSDRRLWNGILNFKNPGLYTLTANSIDGNGNKTSRSLNTFYVAAPSKVVKQGTSSGVNATVTVHYFEPESGAWVTWDGASFGQDNPISTDKKGQFNLLLPAGKYYLSAKAKGYRSLTSNIFKLDQSTPISATLNMKPSGFRPLSWLNFSTQKVDLNISTNQPKKSQDESMGKTLPALNGIETNGNRVNSLDWLGRPTVLTFASTWSPSSAEQLAALADLQTNKDINVVPVASQENAEKVSVYTQIAGYNLNWLVDSDSTFTTKFGVDSLPTSYFIDRNGVIKQVINGVLTKQQMLNILYNL